MKLLLVSFVSVALAAGLFYVFMYFNPWVKFQTTENMEFFAAMYNVRMKQLLACRAGDTENQRGNYL